MTLAPLIRISTQIFANATFVPFFPLVQGLLRLAPTMMDHAIIMMSYLGVAGTPILPACDDSPILSIHVPQLEGLPPYTNPVSLDMPAVTVKPSEVM